MECARTSNQIEKLTGKFQCQKEQWWKAMICRKMSYNKRQLYNVFEMNNNSEEYDGNTEKLSELWVYSVQSKAAPKQ